MQKAIIITGYWNSSGDWNDNTKKLNDYLSEGWTVVNTSPMGAYGLSGYGTNILTDNSDSGFASLVIIQKSI
ncbi:MULTISPECIES: hypothetical protein [Bacillus cereus group]|uniref:hypothetical protein n=1 Tax=Bacillus cereus group TaxID=86661 RepID=UPI001F2326C0|nr:hypothetical protein [Bacillus cereus]MDA1521053.1 hypothetical protein [Bacillus cereus]BCC09499.1 hypothetical protein BCM0060_p2165 [Bacillus cereus]BCC50407.1 hypothetical protein BCJMU02_p2001 [Bacillus cereus]HDR7980551.1 hypothetical protein [Bacillus cereus]HDR8058502.1 hypothetical protein [Bacillus cereus]